MATESALDDGRDVKDHSNGARTRDLLAQVRAGRRHGLPVVRIGHPVLDALAAERSGAARQRALRQNDRRAAPAAPGSVQESPAAPTGRLATAMTLTSSRDLSGASTLHVSSVHRVIDAAGRARDIRIWHELATHSPN